MSSSSVFDYYRMLSLDPTADEHELRRTITILERQWHPSVNDAERAPRVMKRLDEARKILLDPERRREYDESRREQHEEREAEAARYRESTKTSWSIFGVGLFKLAGRYVVWSVIITIFLALISLLE